MYTFLAVIVYLGVFYVVVSVMHDVSIENMIVSIGTRCSIERNPSVHEEYFRYWKQGEGELVGLTVCYHSVIQFMDRVYETKLLPPIHLLQFFANCSFLFHLDFVSIPISSMLIMYSLSTSLFQFCMNFIHL